MKNHTLIILAILFSSLTYGQQKGYYFLPDSVEIHKTFILGQHTYTDSYLLEKSIKGEQEYCIRIRKYSWGDTDTALYREDETNLYTWDQETGKETIDIPKKPVVGQVWFESDSSWRYEIVSINAKLKTPLKSYEGLVVIQAEQLTGRDKEKSSKYLNHYAEGIGYIGSVVNEKLLSYLKE